jgi:hypothetical protein
MNVYMYCATSSPLTRHDRRTRNEFVIKERKFKLMVLVVVVYAIQITIMLYKRNTNP